MFGGLAMLLLVFYGIATGLKVYKRQTDKELKMIAIVVLISLITYFLHGIMNNFLDTDKISALFWGYTAMLVAMDVYHKERKELSGEGNQPV